MHCDMDLFGLHASRRTLIRLFPGKNLRRGLACLALPAILLHFPATGAGQGVQERYTTYVQGERELSRSNATGMALTSGITALYTRFSGTTMSGEAYKLLPDADVLLLYQAANTSAFYTDERLPITDMVLLVDELDARRLATPEQIRKTYQALVGGRLFAQARQWRQRHPNALSTMQMDVANADAVLPVPSVLVFADGEDTPLRRAASAPAAPHIIAIGHPLCHFSQQAANDILARYQVQPGVLTAIQWMAPQQRESDFVIFQRWNASHPGARMSIAYLKDEWPAIDSWETPTFYFVKQGIVQYKLTGWPKEGRMSEFVAGLQSIGLGDLPPPAPGRL